MLSRQLAHELKMANFPRTGIHVSPPALSELVRTCEAENPAGEFVLRKIVHNTRDAQWFAYFTEHADDQPIQGEGQSAEDAVARLWLALEAKSVSAPEVDRGPS